MSTSNSECIKHECASDKYLTKSRPSLMASSVSESNIAHADGCRHSISLHSTESSCFVPPITSVWTSNACENNRNVDEEGDTQECNISQSSRASADFPESGIPENVLINSTGTLPNLDKMCADNKKPIRPIYKYIKNNKCLLCGFESKAKDPYSVRNHLFVHVTNKEFKCDFCDKKFHSMPSLKNHRFVHNDVFLFPCDVCDKKFRSRGSLSSHKVMKHGERRKFKCDVCDKILAGRMSLKGHLRLHTGERPFVCSLCRKAFRQRKQLSCHLRRHYADDKIHQFLELGPRSQDLASSSANASSSSKADVDHPELSRPPTLLRPVESMPLAGSVSSSSAIENIRNAGEEVCPQTFDLSQSVADSVEEREPENALRMDTFDVSGEFDDRCTINTKKIRPLYKYMKNNKCMLCGFESKAKDLYHIRSHLFVHVSDKPFKCDICNRNFRRLEYLMNHRSVHENVFPFSCDLCDKKYRLRATLVNHMKRTHGESTKFVCEVCGKSFTTNVCLKEHSRIHTGERPFVCGICRKSFRRRGCLAKHFRRHYPAKKTQRSPHCNADNHDSASSSAMMSSTSETNLDRAESRNPSVSLPSLVSTCLITLPDSVSTSTSFENIS